MGSSVDYSSLSQKDVQAQMAMQQAQRMNLEQFLNQAQGPQNGVTFLHTVQNKRKGFMKLFRDYLEAHRDTIFTLLLILLVDHYVFKGAFSETIKEGFEKLLRHAHKKIDGKLEEKAV